MTRHNTAPYDTTQHKKTQNGIIYFLNFLKKKILKNFLKKKYFFLEFLKIIWKKILNNFWRKKIIFFLQKLFKKFFHIILRNSKENFFFQNFFQIFFFKKLKKYIIPFCVFLCCVVSCHVIWCCVVSYGVVLCHIDWTV